MTQSSCRICGCTDFNACIQPDGFPCCWVEDDLCSSCAYFNVGDSFIFLETDEPIGKEVIQPASPTIITPRSLHDDERYSTTRTGAS